MPIFDLISILFLSSAVFFGIFGFLIPAENGLFILLFEILVLTVIFFVGFFKKRGMFFAQREEFENILNEAREGIIIHDQNFKILKFNKSAEKIFGLSSSDILGQTITLNDKKNLSAKMIVLTSIIFPALAETVVRRTNPGEYPQILTFTFSEPYLEIKVTTNELKTQKELLFIKLIEDKTRELKLLAQKKEFLTIASHQLQTPLTAINWSIENLKNETLSDTQKAFVASAQGGVSQLLKIVSNLLDVAKIEEGRFGYEFKEGNFIEFLEKILSEIQERADLRKIKIYFDKSGIEILKMSFDPIRLGIALKNILDNSIRYNIQNGEVILKIEKVSDEPYLQISIKDTGVGIDAEDIGKIFGKFFRGNNARRTSVDGNGLGLFIAKNIIARHGGKIWIASKLNRGTIVYFTLPLDAKLIPQREILEEEE